MSFNEQKKHKWRVHVRNLETTIAVGIHEHEQIPQRIIINVTVEGIYPACPQNISECFNYDNIYQLVANVWAKKPHTPLLEQCATELLEHIFRSDKRVDMAQVSVCKPDIFPNVESVGVETQWSRADFEAITTNI